MGWSLNAPGYLGPDPGGGDPPPLRALLAWAAVCVVLALALVAAGQLGR